MVPPLVVVVHWSQAGVAEGGALQESPSAVLAVAIQALQGCQLPAYDALPGRVLHNVGDVQDHGRQYSIVQLELPSEPRHLGVDSIDILGLAQFRAQVMLGVLRFASTSSALVLNLAQNVAQFHTQFCAQRGRS